MNAITYYRKSTDSQDYNRQIQDIASYCNKEGIEIVKEFSESESGKVKVRPELTAMLEYCKKNRPNFCIISELSRIGRTYEIHNTIDTLTNLGVCLISLKESIKTLNPDLTINTSASLVLGVLATINSYELTTLNYRIKSGKLAKATAGNWGGGANLPYGYTTDENKKLVINEDERKLVETIFNLYTSGFGVLKIIHQLNYEGYKTRNGKEWQVQAIHNVLKNSLSSGKRIYKGTVIEVPAIISEETYSKAQKIRITKDNYKGINHKHEYLLNNKIVKCGCCGNSYFGKKFTTKSNTYTCTSNRYGTKDCENLAINIEKLDSIVSNTVLSFFPYMILKNIDNSEINKEISINENLILATEAALTESTKEEKELIKLVLKGFNQDLIDEMLKDILSKRNTLNANLAGYNKKIKELKEDLAHKNNLKLFAKKMKVEGINKELLHSIVSKIVITPVNTQLSTDKNNKTVEVAINIGNDFITYATTQKQKNTVLKVTDLTGEINVYNQLGELHSIQIGDELELINNEIIL